MKYRCIICEGTIFYRLYGGKIINKYTLEQCNFCGMVLAFSIYESETYGDFFDYGDCSSLSSNKVKRVRSAERKVRHIFRKLKIFCQDSKIIDFGCGAGFFCKAAYEAGINVIGVEPSEKLRSFCKEKLKFKNIVGKVDELEGMFDIIFMFDVIEHLNPNITKDIMKKLISHLKPGGLLIGNTPNFKSANILLCKDKDPIIWPPSHSCYFTMKTVDMYLSSLQFKKINLYSRGFSSNSFFRKQKIKKSFLEKGIKETKLYLVPCYISIKIIFKLLGFMLQPFNLGYQIHFCYKLKGVLQ